MPAWVRLMEQQLQQNATLNKNELTALIMGVEEKLTLVERDIQGKIDEVDKKVEVLSKRVINVEILTARVCRLVFCLSNF